MNGQDAGQVGAAKKTTSVQGRLEVIATACAGASGQLRWPALRDPKRRPFRVRRAGSQGPKGQHASGFDRSAFEFGAAPTPQGAIRQGPRPPNLARGSVPGPAPVPSPCECLARAERATEPPRTRREPGAGSPSRGERPLLTAAQRPAGRLARPGYSPGPPGGVVRWRCTDQGGPARPRGGRVAGSLGFHHHFLENLASNLCQICLYLLTNIFS